MVSGQGVRMVGVEESTILGRVRDIGRTCVDCDDDDDDPDDGSTNDLLWNL
jgi:hypothetical protein